MPAKAEHWTTEYAGPHATIKYLPTYYHVNQTPTFYLNKVSGLRMCRAGLTFLVIDWNFFNWLNKIKSIQS